MLTFQQIINQLTDFWATQGCVVQQGHDVEVGAGTFNPTTFLRCLGPEPLQTVYVEPSRRPQDGRFGDNPNRLQLFHQLQVVVKPSPENIQEMYLKSLETIGFDLSKHDVRFVHDDWESPTLGAWGLGWEVWLDGMEVTQFTYFQSVAGFALKPISVELTYGLERISMILQEVDNFFDMKWNETYSYRDIVHRSEVEWSHYNFYQASTEMWLRHFEDFEREAKALIELNLPIPAYDFVMKASHAFNMLEARGVLSVTERTGYITRVRELAKLAATEYLNSREKLGFPLLKKMPSKQVSQPLPKVSEIFNPKEYEDFLIEIGSEQLPATFVPIGCRNLENALKKLLADFELAYGSIEVYGTPRRLAALVKGLAQGSEDQEQKRKGPPVSTAFDENGKVTKQGIGFFKSTGISTPPSLDDIQDEKQDTFYIQTIKGHDYLMADIKKKGMSSLALLQEHLPKLITDLSFPKKMRWGDIDVSYARPLHWIVALHGSRTVPFEIASIRSSNVSRGHMQLSPESFEIKNASDYCSLLFQFHVNVDTERRKHSILEQLEEIEQDTKTKVLEKNKVLSQVLFLSEWPVLTHGTFDSSFLKVPEEVLISEMVEHQKYFPLADKKGALTNHFVITADNAPNPTIVAGNQNVLSARLADGAFLYEEDLKTTLDAFSEKLKYVIFQKDLGTVAEKRDRLKHLSVILAQALEVPKEKAALRAAYLSKADLATELVQEFPDLQGTIGKHYAAYQKEAPEVALAIEEHWLPKSEGGDLPTSELGSLLSLADKLDNLVGYFSVGLKPTSSSDPYALRRQTIGIMKILIENRWSLDLKQILNEACQLLPNPEHKAELIDEILLYFTSRAKGVLEDYGFKKDEIEASLRGTCVDPYDQYLKTEALHLFRQTDSFALLYEVYKRAKGQIEKQKQQTLSPTLLAEPAEKNLHDSLKKIETPLQSAAKKKDYQVAFRELSRLQKPLAHLFDQVKILADDPQIQSNRIALLQEVFSRFSLLLDFGKIQVL